MKPKFPGIILPTAAIDRINENIRAYEEDPEGYEKREQEWSLNECIARGCLPTGEPIECKFGPGPWSDNG